MSNMNRYTGQGWNADDIPEGDFAPIPEGEYLVQIVKSELQPTQANNGEFLYLEHEIIQGEYSGRKLFNRLNLDNPSQQAVEIAERQFASICRAVGVLTPQDSEDLHNKPLVASVTIDGTYNRISYYRAAKRQQRAPAPQQRKKPEVRKYEPDPAKEEPQHDGFEDDSIPF